jgi:hypothetical protein
MLGLLIALVSTFTNFMKLLLAQIAAGRMLLHLGCLCRGGGFRFHSAGVAREIKAISKKCIPLKVFIGRNKSATKENEF